MVSTSIQFSELRLSLFCKELSGSKVTFKWLVITIVGTTLSPVMTHHILPTFWLLSNTDLTRPAGETICLSLCWFNHCCRYGLEPPGAQKVRILSFQENIVVWLFWNCGNNKLIQLSCKQCLVLYRWMHSHQHHTNYAKNVLVLVAADEAILVDRPLKVHQF